MLIEKTPQLLAAHFAKKKQSPIENPRPSRPSPVARRSRMTDIERAAAYCLALDQSIEGQRGSDRLFHAACACVLGFDLTPEQAFEPLAIYNDARASPPWQHTDLWKKLRDADAQPGPRGYLRDAEYSPPKSFEMAWCDTWTGDFHTQTRIHHCGTDGAYLGCTYKTPPVDPGPDLSDLARAFGGERKSIPFLDLPTPPPPCNCCPTPHNVAFLRNDSIEWGNWKFPCQRLKCPFCGAILREEYAAYVAAWLARLAHSRRDQDTQGVYVFRVPVTRWGTVSRYLNSHAAQWTRLDDRFDGDDEDGLSLVVSTVKHPKHAAEEMTPEAAAAYFRQAVKAMPQHARRKCFTHSRNLPPLREKKDKPSEWKRLGRLDRQDEGRLEVARRWNRQPRFFGGKNGFWPYTGWIVNVANLNRSKIIHEMEEGGVMYTDDEMYRRDPPPPDPDDFEPDETATPPPRYSFVLAP